MLREIKASEAFKSHEEGQDIKVLAPSAEGGYDWIDIAELITGCKFFIEEKEKSFWEPEPGNPEEPPETFPMGEPLAVPPRKRESVSR